MVYDVLVVGSGPAGLAAGATAGQHGLAVTLFEEESIGGELVNRHTIEDFPGRSSVSGPELRSKMVEQLGEYDVPVRLATVESIHDEDPFVVGTTDGEYRARTVIVAAGGRPSRLDVPGAETYEGRGVFYCAMCDGPLYADGVVAVSGSDDWALTDALFLAEHASTVIVIEPRSRATAGQSLRERAESHSDIEIETGTELRSVDGDGVLERLELADTETGVGRTIAVDGLYVQHGIEPDTAYLPDAVSTTGCGAIVVDAALETDVGGLFAAGDVRQSSPRTVATAVGDGVTACRSAIRHLE